MLKFIRGFGYAFQGIGNCLWRERNMRVHFSAIVLVLYWCCFFRPTAMEFIFIVICFGVVTAMECMNTAVESLADKLSKEQHPLIKQAKDCAAGAVLLTAIASAITGCILFLQQPRFSLAIQNIFSSPLWTALLIILLISTFCFVFLLPVRKKTFRFQKKEKKD